MRSSALSAEAVATGRLSGSFRLELLKLLKTTPAVSAAAALIGVAEVAKVSREEHSRRGPARSVVEHSFHPST